MFLHNKSYYAPPALGSKGPYIWLSPSLIPLAHSAITNNKTTRSFSTYSPTTDMVVTSKNKTKNTRRFLLTCYASGGATLGSSPKQTPKMETLIQSLLLGLNMTAKARKPFVCAVGTGLNKNKIKGSFVSTRKVDTKNSVVGTVVIPTKPCAQRSGDGWNTLGIPTIPLSAHQAPITHKQKYNLLQTIIYMPTTYVGLSPLNNNNKSASDGWHASRDNPQDFYTPTANSPVLGLVPVTRSYSLTGQNAPIDLGHRPKSINKTYKTFLSYWLLPLIGLFTAVGGVDKTSYAIVCRDASEATLANGFDFNPLTSDKFCLPTLASGLSGHKQQSKAIELMAQSAMSYQKKPFLNQLYKVLWVGPNEMTLGGVLHTPPKKSNGPALDLGLARVFTHSYLDLPSPAGKSGLYANTHNNKNKKTSYALKTTNNLESSGSKSVGLHAKSAYANQRSGYIKDTILNWPAGQNQQLLPKSPRNKFTYGQGLRFSKPTAYTLFDSAQTKNQQLRFKDITTYNKQTPVTSYKEVLLFLDSLIQKLNWNTFGLTYPPTSGIGKTDWRFVLGGPRNQSASTSTLQSISKINNTPTAELLSDYGGYMAGFAGKPKTYHINSSIFKLLKNYLIKGATDQKQGTAGNLINTNPQNINPQYNKQTNKKLAAFVGGVQSSYNMLILNNMLFPESGFAGFGLLPLPPNEVNNQNLDLGSPLKPTHVVVRTQHIPIITASWGAIKNDVRTPKYVDLNTGSSFKVATLGGPTKDISTPEAQGAQLLAGSAQNVYSGANDYGMRANKTNYVPTYGGPTIQKQNNLNTRLNLSSTQIKSIKGNKSFSNYIKYLRTNLNKLAGRVTLGQMPHIKLNKYNTTKILSNYLPKNNTKNTIFIAGLSDFVSTRNVDTKHFGPPEAAHNNMRVHTKYAKGVYPTKVQNAIPIVLQHKKLLGGVLPTLKRPNILKNGAGAELPIYQQNVKAGLHVGRANLISAHGGHALEELNKHKKDMQKKRKAKKQRLESRRKKKRKRFYPRPNWLRLRLGLWVSEKTYLVKKGFKGVHHVFYSIPKRFSTSGPLANNAMRVAKPSKFDLYPRVAWIQKESFNSLNNYIQTLSKSMDAAPQAGLIKQRSALISPFSSMPNNASPTRTYQLASKNTLYNNMVYNLWLASKKTNNNGFGAAVGTDVNKPTNKISLLDGLGGRHNSIPPQAEYATQSSKKKKSAYGDYSKISTYNYKKKLLMSAPSAHQILTTFKNKASYATFEDKSNQNIPKKEINKNNLRDFWIWLYNITNTNKVNQKMYINNMLNYLSIPIISVNKAESGRLEALAQNHQQMSDTPVQVQPSIYGSLDNIAIKTKARKGDFIKSAGLPAQKAILSAPGGNGLTLNTVNLANWSLNKTNLWSSTTQRMNYWSTQKLRNQSKNNKTKYIEKQFKKQLNNLFTNLVARKALYAGAFGSTVQNPTTPDDGHNQNRKSKKHKLTISQKMHQKEMKLSYITSGFTGFGLRGVRTQKLSLPIIKNFVLPNANPKSDIYKSNLGPAGGAVGFLTKPSTISWFEGFDFMGVRAGGAHLSKSIEGKTLSSTIGQKNNQKTLAHLWPITICALLLHFSALISLISISQIRCFIKFHFILLYKLWGGANIYLQLIYGAHDYIMRTLENNQFINSVATLFVKNLKISKPVATWQNLYKPNKVGLHAPYNGSKATTGIFGFRSFGLKKQNKKVKYSGPGKPNKNYNPNYLSSYGGMRNLLDSSILGLSQFKGFVKNSKKASAVSGYTNSKITIAAGNKKAKNIVKLSNFLMKLAFFLPTAFNRFYMGFGIQNQRIGVNQQVVSKPAVGQVNILLTKYLIYQNLVQLKTKTMSYSAFGAIKKGTYNTSLQIVDTFEYFLRIIYGFFEKPAELTMDWIAYAFLVEWSSDLLTFTPENKDKQNWLAFSKIARQNKPLLPILSAITFAKNNNFLLTGLSNKSLTIAWGGASFIFSLGGAQFIYKRILYLNDMFIEIFNRPDTDLIYRQKKGTLFWEIWSDILIKAADQYNINIPSLSNIKEEQNLLIDRFLSESSNVANVGLGKNQNIQNYKRANLTHQKTFIKVKNTNKITYGPSVQFNRSSVFDLGTNLQKQTITIDQKALYAPAYNIKADIKGVHDYVVRTNTEFVTYKSKETDLFLDYHPPKSFIHLSSIQYYSLVQQPIGTLVCQIYSGILNKQISKNILVIGSTLNSKTYTAFERMQKTLLIQALAGETEIKIITDNAHRYAIVNRGFAVGIKLLKDVFEALALNTPCLFLLEDIHLIGERRPLLISDNGDSLGDEMGKATEVAFGAQRNGDAVHEKNQVLYQFNRHGITHYQKPFKGDFSAGGGLSIPTNHFSFDLFFKTRYSNFASTPTNPLAYLVDFSSEGQTANSKNNSSEKDSHAIVQKIISQRKAGLAGAGGPRQKTSNYLSSSLQLTRNQLLSPPSTSPFTVLLLKEQKKLKPKKIVKELPWVGLPSEQLALLPRVSYSVRAKVAALADLSFSNMSAKFDMITDLLVIIDSVRGNRGFVVFATTHLPHILDPALRRPGRLDETISIPTLSNIWNRWEFTKAPQPVIGLDCFWPTAKNNKTEKHPIGLSTAEAPRFMSNNLVGYHGTLDYLDFLNLDLLPNQKINILSPILTALPSGLNKEQGFCVTPMADMARMPAYGGSKTRKRPTKPQTISGAVFSGPTQNNIGAHSVVVRAIQPEMGPTAPKQKSLERVRTTAPCAQKTNNIAYYQMGRKFIRNLVVMGGRAKHAPANLLNFSPIYNNSKTYNSTTLLTETREFLATEIQYKSIYSSTHVIKNTLIGLISGKFSELFAFKTIPISKKAPKSLDTPILDGVSNKQATGAHEVVRGGALRSSSSVLQNLAPQGPYKNHTTLYGIDETWRAAMSLALSFVQKRYLYNKNLIVPKLLNFLDYSSLEEAPSPPASNILIPAKRYENYKKVFKENLERKVSFDINGAYGPDKIEKHIKQSFIQSIYKNFQSPQSLIPASSGETKDGAEVGGLHAPRANNISNKINSPAGGGNKIAKLRSLALLETPQNPIFMQTTNITWYYQNKLLKRHKNYLTNQWWNGQLIEHNAETLFLSDIDWRYTFYSPASGAEGGAKKLQNTFVKNSSASKNTATEGQIRTNANGVVINKHNQSNIQNIQDILLDFPDSDQHYNPKHRRWMLNAGYWSSWFSFDKKLQTDILNHFIFECFITSYNILNRNRELLDYSVTKYIQKGLIKEINVIHILQKF